MQTLVQDLEVRIGWVDMRCFLRLPVSVHYTCIKGRVSRRIQISDYLQDSHLPCHSLAGFDHPVLLRNSLAKVSLQIGVYRHLRPRMLSNPPTVGNCSLPVAI